VLQLTSNAGIWLQLVLATMVAGVAYLVAAWLMGVAEVRQLWQQRRRLRR
jgi:hypothetical protein